MSNAYITWTQGDQQYKLVGLLGNLAESEERNLEVQVGDVRLIAGMKMYAYTIERAKFFGKWSDTVKWASTDPKMDYPKIKQWLNNVVKGQGVL